MTPFRLLAAAVLAVALGRSVQAQIPAQPPPSAITVPAATLPAASAMPLVTPAPPAAAASQPNRRPLPTDPPPTAASAASPVGDDIEPRVIRGNDRVIAPPRPGPKLDGYRDALYGIGGH